MASAGLSNIQPVGQKQPTKALFFKTCVAWTTSTVRTGPIHHPERRRRQSRYWPILSCASLNISSFYLNASCCCWYKSHTFSYSTVKVSKRQREVNILTLYLEITVVAWPVWIVLYWGQLFCFDSPPIEMSFLGKPLSQMTASFGITWNHFSLVKHKKKAVDVWLHLLFTKLSDQLKCPPTLCRSSVQCGNSLGFSHAENLNIWGGKFHGQFGSRKFFGLGVCVYPTARALKHTQSPTQAYVGVFTCHLYTCMCETMKQFELNLTRVSSVILCAAELPLLFH